MEQIKLKLNCFMRLSCRIVLLFIAKIMDSRDDAQVKTRQWSDVHPGNHLRLGVCSILPTSRRHCEGSCFTMLFTFIHCEYLDKK